MVAAPIARAILEDSISALNIEKQEGGLEKEFLWYDTKYDRVPDVIGLSSAEAKRKLKSFQVEIEGIGSRVIEMSPSANSYIPVDSTIRLMMSN